MGDVASAMLLAFRSLLHPRILALVIWPLLGAAVLWGGLAYYFWQDWVGSINHVLASYYLSWLAGALVSVMAFLILTPLVLITALLIASVVVMPVMTKHVARYYYPNLEERHGGSNLGSVWNGLVALFGFCALWLVTLPLWLFIGPFTVILHILLTAYLNQRLFPYDALADHADKTEIRAVKVRWGGRMWLLGAAVSLIQFIPIVNFFAPIYIGLAYIHLCLNKLNRLRHNQGFSTIQTRRRQR